VLADPFTWRCLAETEGRTARFDMRLAGARPEAVIGYTHFDKPAGEDLELVRRAAEGEAARVLLDFARFPVARLGRTESGGRVVQFADLRYTEPGARARVGGFALDVPVNSRQ
jgi:hypothetical protein